MRLACFGSCVVAALGLVSGVSAAPIFSDGFEDAPVGPVGAGPAGWVHNRGWGNQGEIVTTHSFGGAQSLRIDDSSDTQSSGYLTKSFTEQAAGKWTLQLFVRPTANTQSIEISLLSAGTTTFSTAILRNDGTIGYVSRGSWQNSSAVGYAADMWQKLEITVDLDAKTWDLEFNDAAVVSGVAAGTPSAAASTLGQIQIVGGSSAVTSFYVDNVSLSAVPEPAAVSVLVAGLTLLGRRRR